MNVSAVYELWADVPGYAGIYQASSHGRIRSLDRLINHPNGPTRLRGRPLRPRLHLGYPHVNLWRDGRGTAVAVHQIVALTFLGPCPDGQEVLHWNDVRDDCRLTNLRYGTRKQNMADAVRNGRKLGRPTRRGAAA
ncbi:HNH endonuclease [Mycobacterium bourgelatii]|nr:HNH endonuclease [Mycobacterium bourgelatii]